MDPSPASTISAMRRFQTDGAALIAELRSRPCLWDRAHAHYRRRAAKERAWQDVCAALHPSYHLLDAAQKHELGIIIMRKWYNIRDAYRKTFSSKHSRPYLYGELLTFLDAGIRAGERAPRPGSSPGPDEPADGEEWLNVPDLEEDAPPLKRHKTLEYSTGRTKEEPDESLVSVLVDLLEKEEDEDRAFFKSITPSVKALSEEAKFVFRIQVMKLLNGLRRTARGVKVESLSDGSDGDHE